MTASFSPVVSFACFRRDEYNFRYTHFSGSVEARSLSKTSYLLSSRSCASRVRASMRKCLSHLGQTFKFSSRSFFQIICRQLSHFTHSPSVRTRFSPAVSISPDCRLNQVIRNHRGIGASGDRVIGSSNLKTLQDSRRDRVSDRPMTRSPDLHTRFLSVPSVLFHRRAFPAASPLPCRQARQLSDARSVRSR